MSEISKVYKQYGTTTGKQYLILFYSSMISTAHYNDRHDEKGLSAYNARLESYIKKEYGQEFFSSYHWFAVAAKSNQKLIKELKKFPSVFTSKSIIDLEKEPPTTKKEENNGEESWKAAARKIDVVGQKSDVGNSSRRGSVSIKGFKMDYSYDEPDKAIPVVKSAVFLQPHDADNWCALGDLYAEKKDWKTAVACYDKALLKNAKSSRAVSGRKKAAEHVKEVASEPLIRNNPPSVDTVPSTKQEPVAADVVYYFENQEEFLVYVGANKDKIKGNIIWGKGSQYVDKCRLGYSLMDQKRYYQAIDAYEKALEANPVGVTARFEISSAYSQLHNLSEARKALKEVEPYLYSDNVIAKYYRNLGYILIEEKYFKTAACSYQYSLYLDPDQQMAKQEILYIVNQAGFEIMEAIRDRKNVEDTLKNAGVPLLKPAL